jgi:hypothetical protein
MLAHATNNSARPGLSSPGQGRSQSYFTKQNKACLGPSDGVELWACVGVSAAAVQGSGQAEECQCHTCNNLLQHRSGRMDVYSFTAWVAASEDGVCSVQ